MADTRWLDGLIRQWHAMMHDGRCMIPRMPILRPSNLRAPFRGIGGVRKHFWDFDMEKYNVVTFYLYILPGPDDLGRVRFDRKSLMRNLIENPYCFF